MHMAACARDMDDWFCLDMDLTCRLPDACGAVVGKPCPLFPDCYVCGHSQHAGEVLRPVNSDEAAARHAAAVWSADTERLRANDRGRRRGKRLDRARVERVKALRAKRASEPRLQGRGRVEPTAKDTWFKVTLGSDKLTLDQDPDPDPDHLSTSTSSTDEDVGLFWCPRTI
jgi:hypothetical protein